MEARQDVIQRRQQQPHPQQDPKPQEPNTPEAQKTVDREPVRRWELYRTGRRSRKGQGRRLFGR